MLKSQVPDADPFYIRNRTARQMSDAFYDEFLFDAVQRLGLALDSEAFAIAMQVVHHGHSSLSPAQNVIWETEVLPLLVAQEEQYAIVWDSIKDEEAS
jgi:hypothetical protein